MDKVLTKQFILENLDCSNCALKIESELSKLDNVKKASVNFATKTLTIETRSFKQENTYLKIKNLVKNIEPDVEVYEKINQRIKTEDNIKNKKNIIEAVRIIIGAAIFITALIFKFRIYLEFCLYLISYLLTGADVILKAFKNIIKGRIFNENSLMIIATSGAFAIKQFPEAAAVMLFYKIGEYIQNIAVNRSRKSIASLMDVRPEYANIKHGNDIRKIPADEVNIGDTILIKPGERVPLDGKIIKGNSNVDVSALTGESVPRDVHAGNKILSGFVNLNGVLIVRVTKKYNESTVSKILDMIENSSSKKAPTESFMAKFASYYTPFILGVAFFIAVLPPLIIKGAVFSDWIYRALVLMVISCPCALMVSIPLGFFGGIGAASKNGIMIKGGNYLEALNYVEMVVFDKTGTLTKGIFKVAQINAKNNFSKKELLEFAAYGESFSNHPIASSILHEYGKKINKELISDYEDIPGFGSRIKFKNNEIIIGNSKLMKRYGIKFIEEKTAGSVVYVAVDFHYAGYLIVSDEVKKNSKAAVKKIKDSGVKKIVMFTGDNKKIGELIGSELGIDEVYTELLPDQKVKEFETLEEQKSRNSKIIFVGDGVNDAPVLARADIGVAMGGLGSDAAIESADIVIMDDDPMKLVSAINIAKRTKRIVWENILMALGIKIVILTLGAFGAASMWEAVFADVGVTLLAVLNTLRVLRVKNF
ncbi:cadmium-translocating P-type ATPase [bacterium]|nr:cadmium-translocating P-type ATPase [bacterium]